MDFQEIAERGFLQNPTDNAFTEELWQELHEEWLNAVKNQDDKVWDILQKLKLVGKFLPLDDNRNPDNTAYDRQQG